MTPVPTRPRRHVVLYVLALVLACVSVAGGVVVYRTQDNREAAKTEQERYGDVVEAASAEAVAIVTIDYRDLDSTFDRVTGGATGQFLKEYTDSWDEQLDLFEQSRSITSGEVRSAAVSTIDDDSATVMVVIKGTAQNAATGNKPQERRYRLRLDVVNVEDEWLTSKLEFVG